MKKTNYVTVSAFILMILTSVFGATNIGTGFYQMGYAAIPMFILGGILFFIPFLMMMVEFSSGFSDSPGGIFTWMQKSVSLKFAFVGIMIWYASYVIWMFSKSLSIWVPLSFFLFGGDITTSTLNISLFGHVLNLGPISPFTLGMLGIVLILIIFSIVSKGSSTLSKVTSIGGIFVITLNLTLIIGGIIAYVINGFALKAPLSIAAFSTSPNPSFQGTIPFLGFLVFAIFAYGGTEAIAGVAQDMKNPKQDAKKAILIAGAFIMICYIIGFLAAGTSSISSEFGKEVTPISALFIIMGNLGNTIAPNTILGEVLIRFSGFSIVLSWFGALIALSYAPLKQLIEGTPKEFWPKSFQKENKHGLKVNALMVQSFIVIVFLLTKSIFSLFSPSGSLALYNLLIAMTNVGMTIPSAFLIYAWFKYRRNNNLKKEIIMINSNILVTCVFISAMAAVLFGNIFSIISPFLSGDIQTGIWAIIGPILFTTLAFIIYGIAKKNYPDKIK